MWKKSRKGNISLRQILPLLILFLGAVLRLAALGDRKSVV